jgi:hypothetical protein
MAFHYNRGGFKFLSGNLNRISFACRLVFDSATTSDHSNSPEHIYARNASGRLGFPENLINEFI